MAFQSPTLFPLLLSTILLLSLTVPGFGGEDIVHFHLPDSNTHPKKDVSSKGISKQGLQGWKDGSPRRLMIGSTAPTCTYNECRRCRFRCSAEQVPVDGSDPINSAYHYRCMCHR